MAVHRIKIFSKFLREETGKKKSSHMADISDVLCYTGKSYFAVTHSKSGAAPAD